MILAASHPAWLAPSIIVAVIIAAVTLLLGYLNSRLTGQDRRLETVEATTTDTRVSVARIEGYMARSNGGGAHATQLPDLPPPVVVHDAPGKVVIEKQVD